MTPLVPWIAFLTGLAAALGTGWLRRHALRANWLDVPNARSAHAIPTPRGGGLAIVLSASVGISILATLGMIDGAVWLALVPGGLAVATVGFVDDRRSLAPSVRLTVHVAAACFAVAVLGGVPPLQFGTTVADLGWTGNVLGVLAIGWTLNLFNFMDGIDGIAASEAIFIAAGAVLIAVVLGRAGGAHAAALVFAGACAGFLAWNWPPARIFMGDVASGYVGYTVAVLALAAGRGQSSEPFLWLTLGAAFFADATTTLVRRVLRGERVHEAHRMHAYQHLARRWRSHGKVSAGLAVANLAWSAPLAAAAALRPERAAGCAVLALAGWLVVAVVAGAGRREPAGPAAANRIEE
jgi:Fuc2NAc and GlcNAc transferase